MIQKACGNQTGRSIAGQLKGKNSNVLPLNFVHMQSQYEHVQFFVHKLLESRQLQLLGSWSYFKNRRLGESGCVKNIAIVCQLPTSPTTLPR